MDEPLPTVLAQQLALLQKLRAEGALSDGEFQEIERALLRKEPGVAPWAQPTTETGTTQHDNQEQAGPEVTPIGNAYRAFKVIALDALIVLVFGFVGEATVSIAFHFNLGSRAAIVPLAVAKLLSYTLGFSVVGARIAVPQYWRHLVYVAIIAWLTGIISVAVLRLPIMDWVFSGIGVALSVAIGGGIGLLLRSSSTSLDTHEPKSRAWGWRKIPRRTLLMATSSVAAIAIFGISLVAYDAGSKLTTYSELKLGMTMQEVKYAKGGSPVTVGEFQPAKDQDLTQAGVPVYDILTQRTLLVFAAIKLPEGRRVEDYPIWAYNSADKRTVLRADFDPHTKRLISIACDSPGYSSEDPYGLMDCPELLGIQDRWREDDLIKKLGNPTEQNTKGDVKIIGYKDLGVQFFLMNEHVYMLRLYSPP